MAGRERNCKWHFSNHPQGSREDGPNNPLEQSFKKHPYASLIRESIQNSLDAVCDRNKPVVVKFSFKEMIGSDYPAFFELEKHIQGCLDYYPQNRNAKLLFEPMLKLFNGENKYHQEINYIRVSDYNTVGMAYKDGDTNKPFYAFVRSAGVSAKDSTQAGGSFGFGKAAYFLLSPISTIIVSTCTKENEKFFEGVSSLCTHTYEDEKKMSVGYYDSNNGMPVCEEEEIPSKFRRDEPGTDINILGFDVRDKEDAIREMIEAVLRNFWMAIYNNRLSVVIDDNVEINKDTIASHMETYFPDENDNSRKGGYDNPRPYFDAVRFAGTSSRYIKVEDNLSLLGHCTLYLNRQKNATDKMAYLRDLQMLVYSKRTKTNYGVYGVFYCEDSHGNEILRNLENPAHDEWKASNWTKLGKKVPTGNSALKTLDAFVNKGISDMFSGKNKLAINIKGLEEFLYIPTEYEEDEELESEALVGNPTGTIKEEGSSPTTDIPDTVDNPTLTKGGKDTSTGVVMVQTTTNATASSDGPLRSGHGEKPRKTKGGGIKKPGDTREQNESNEDGKHGVYASPISLPYRTFSQHEGGLLYHYVVLHSEDNIHNVRLHFYSVGEDGEEVLEIVETSEGDISGTAIENIQLTGRRKRLRIRFADRMKHTIKLEAEELHEV